MKIRLYDITELADQMVRLRPVSSNRMVQVGLWLALGDYVRCYSLKRD
jgi:hypothetical protein